MIDFISNNPGWTLLYLIVIGATLESIVSKIAKRQKAAKSDAEAKS